MNTHKLQDYKSYPKWHQWVSNPFKFNIISNKDIKAYDVVELGKDKREVVKVLEKRKVTTESSEVKHVLNNSKYFEVVAVDKRRFILDKGEVVS